MANGMKEFQTVDATVVENASTKRALTRKLARFLAIPTVVGALTLGAVANGAFAQDGTTANAPQAAGIFAGTCDAPGASAFALNDVALTDDDGRQPSGDPVDAAGAAEVLISGTQLNGTNIDALIGQPHVLVVNGADGTAVACGEIGGYLYENEDLYIGLRARNGSGVAGVALIEGDDDDNELDVTVYLVTEAAGGAAATSAS